MDDIITWESVRFDLVAAIVTFLLSRVTLWVMRSWDGGVARLASAHLAAWILCSAVYLLRTGMWIDLVDFAVLEGLWFGVDLARGKGRRAGAASESLGDTFS